MKGFVRSTTQTVYDSEGNATSVTEAKQFVYKSDEEPFYNIFINYVHWMFDINSAVTLKVLLYMLEIAEFNTGCVRLTIGERDALVKKLGIRKQALSRSIRELLDAGAISIGFEVDKETGEQIERRGEYLINPEMFWKGELAKRKKLLVEFRAVYDELSDGVAVSPQFSSTQTI